MHLLQSFKIHEAETVLGGSWQADSKIHAETQKTWDGPNNSDERRTELQGRLPPLIARQCRAAATKTACSRCADRPAGPQDRRGHQKQAHAQAEADF